MPLHIDLIAAARPNFMKIAPLWHALAAAPWAAPRIVHTGQHYDRAMSDVFFEELGLPAPHVNLGIGSGSHGQQTGRVLEAYEALILGQQPDRTERPDLVVVVGDVNATPAAALAAVKLGIKTAHLEAGLRSFDRSMPEEINRLVTDAICDFLWTPSPDADENLLREGIAPEKILRVGNIMIDSLELLRPHIEADASRTRLGLPVGRYALVTLHRPANVDKREQLEGICAALSACARESVLVFPLHPRTRTRLEAFGLLQGIAGNPRIILTDPLPYLAFMNLVFGCSAVITDSGGVQEETSYLGIPCLTLRENTERPITLQQGTNRLLGAADLVKEFMAALARPRLQTRIDLWDGKAAERIVAAIAAMQR